MKHKEGLCTRADEDGAGDAGGHGTSSALQPFQPGFQPPGASRAGCRAPRAPPAPRVVAKPCRGSANGDMPRTLPWAPLRQLAYLQLWVKAD